jgi:hypothetical protein
VKCVECGEQFPEERAKLGYDYCTRDTCQAKRHRGVKIVAVGVNKSSDVLMVADEDGLRTRATAGEFARKDTGLGLGYRAPTAAPPTGRPSPHPIPRQRSADVAKRPWTAEQEKIVRLYHEMGLNPTQIVERARRNTPRLGITTGLVTKIMSTPPRR